MPQRTAPSAGQNKPYHKSEQPHVRPFRITWHGKTYKVNNVRDYHTSVENGTKLHVFTATDGTGTFELKFSGEDVAWFLGG
jgi:hypothetical protein